MSTPSQDPERVAQQRDALLELIESDRRAQCERILGEARAAAAARLAQAHAAERKRMHAALQVQRELRRERIAAAQARLATRRRLHAQQRSAALLKLAWTQLPDALRALWRQPDARRAWAASVLQAARSRLPPDGWRVLHAPDWPAGEQQIALQPLRTQALPGFEADPAIDAGLKVRCGGNVIDGTLAGLLADRAEIEARLLHRLEDKA